MQFGFWRFVKCILHERKKMLRSIGKWTFLTAMWVGFAIFVFDPIGWRHFLRDVHFAEALRPFAIVLGLSGAILAFYAVAKIYQMAQNKLALGQSDKNDRRYRFITNPVIFVMNLLLSPFLGFYIIYEPFMVVVPLSLHYSVRSDQFEASFSIEGLHATKGCRGVDASNPEFYDDVICGVSWEGHISPYIGRDMTLYGTRSAYGFLTDHYAMPQLPPDAGSASKAVDSHS